MAVILIRQLSQNLQTIKVLSLTAYTTSPLVATYKGL